MDDLITGLHGLVANKDIESLEVIMLKIPQVDCSVYHRFGPSLYIREVNIPAGTMAIGHHQKLEHMNVFLKGRVMMFNDDGTTTELIAPMMFVGKPGRKVGYILEDMVWQNIYATDETDVEKLESMFLDKSEHWIQSEAQRIAMLRTEREVDRIDYRNMLEETGFTEEIARQQSENETDLIDMDVSLIQVGNSPIEGKGIFATAEIKYGEIIALARIGEKRTIAGRYTNHAAHPNAEMRLNSGGDIELVALRDLYGCKGGQLGEEITVDYRRCLAVAKQANSDHGI
jgi:hypothetical protein